MSHVSDVLIAFKPIGSQKRSLYLILELKKKFYCKDVI